MKILRTKLYSTHGQTKWTFRCAAHLHYRQQIKLDTDLRRHNIQCRGTRGDSTGGV